MKASLVFDGYGQPAIPESMGTPSPDQLQGTPLENLGELSARICYGSLGNGRSSAKLHEHILDVVNLSVYEHCVFTVRFFDVLDENLFCRTFLNRKGIWVDIAGLGTIDVTVNFRAILEWNKYATETNSTGYLAYAHWALRSHAYKLAPMIYPPYAFPSGTSLKTEGLTEDQAWATLYLSGSRGFTHEQVRHRFAMSQRSTRYVDESESPYVEHPLITRYLADENILEWKRLNARDYINEAVEADRDAYRYLVRDLEAYLSGYGLGKQTARKQARGAARGYLGNALSSEMLFSAPVSGWKGILRQRLTPQADAEIRVIMADALRALKASRHGHFFGGFSLVASPDGMGEVLDEQREAR